MLVDRSRLIFSLKDPSRTFFINFLNSFILFIWFLEKGVWHGNITYIRFICLSFYDIIRHLKSILGRIDLERKGYTYVTDLPDEHCNLLSLSMLL